MSKKSKQRLYRRGSTLPMIVSLLLGSAVLRVAIGADTALAVGSDEGPTMEDQMTTEMSCGPDDTPAALLEALQAREARVTDLESQIEDRMQALRVAESEINEKLTALEEAEESLSSLLSIADSAAEDDISRLTAVYENMKPQEAAALFEQMEPAFSAGFMGRMQPEAAALIMSNLDPETAHIISVVLAGRNASVPVE